MAVQTDLQEMLFCGLLEEGKETPNIGLPIRNVRYTNFHVLAKCFPDLNGQLESYAKFSS